MGHKASKRKSEVDAVAASILLRTYLDRAANAAGAANGEDAERGGGGA